MNQKPKIVEFIGVSGSGKTTLYKKITRLNKKYNSLEIAAFRGLINNPKIKIPGRQILRILPENIISILNLTKIRYLYIDQVISFSETSEFDKTFTNLNNYLSASTDNNKEKMLLTYNILKNICDLLLIMNPINNNKIILVDEFFLQKIFSLKINDKQISIYLDKLGYKIDLLLKLNEESTVSLSRLRSRGVSRNSNIKNIGDEELLERIKDSQRTTNLIATILKDNKLNILEVDNDTNLKTIINTIDKI